MNRLRQTHTYVHLELSSAAYAEIAQRLKDAGYDHVMIAESDGRIALDMQGIAVIEEKPT